MFCPKCATQNVEGASYCRSCGANISLVPQALTGHLPVIAQQPDYQYYGLRRRRGGPSMDYAVRSLTMGIAFAVMIALTSKFAPGSNHWWFWLLIPTMLFFSRGFAEMVRLNRSKNQFPVPPGQPLVNAVRTPDLPAPRTGELMTPVPSVTEGTTRHLATEPRTRQLDDQRPS